MKNEEIYNNYKEIAEMFRDNHISTKTEDIEVLRDTMGFLLELVNIYEKDIVRDINLLDLKEDLESKRKYLSLWFIYLLLYSYLYIKDTYFLDSQFSNIWELVNLQISKNEKFPMIKMWEDLTKGVKELIPFTSNVGLYMIAPNEPLLKW